MMTKTTKIVIFFMYMFYVLICIYDTFYQKAKEIETC